MKLRAIMLLNSLLRVQALSYFLLLFSILYSQFIHTSHLPHSLNTEEKHTERVLWTKLGVAICSPVHLTATITHFSGLDSNRAALLITIWRCFIVSLPFHIQFSLSLSLLLSSRTTTTTTTTRKIKIKHTISIQLN